MRLSIEIEALRTKMQLLDQNFDVVKNALTEYSFKGFTKVRELEIKKKLKDRIGDAADAASLNVAMRSEGGSKQFQAYVDALQLEAAALRRDVESWQRELRSAALNKSVDTVLVPGAQPVYRDRTIHSGMIGIAKAACGTKGQIGEPDKERRQHE